MVRYQKHPRNATKAALNAGHRAHRCPPHVSPWSGKRALRVLPALLLLLALAGAVTSPAHAQTSGAGAPVLILPAQSTAVILQTHTTDLTLSTAGSSVLAGANAFYRLRNESLADAVVSALFAAPLPDETRATLPGDLTVTVNGEAITLQPAEGGSTAQLVVPGNGRLDVRLSYSLNLGEGAALGVRFPAAALDEWTGSTSFRLTVNVPTALGGEAWLSVQPEGWRFGPTDTSDATAIQWLYEGNLPRDPLVFTFVNPQLWQQIVELRAAAQTGGVLEVVALGNAYARLAAEGGESGVRDRFYGQALAAYSSALERGAAAGAQPADLATVYAGQAQLYRQRVISPSGAVSPEHAQLLIESVVAALGSLAPNSTLRSELQQWLNDGLTIVLTDARERRDWETALDTLDQLAAAPGGAVDEAFVAEERERILFEQSLQLLEEGQRDEAVAVSGTGIVGQDLQPAADEQALFASWQSTLTVTTRASELALVGVPAAGKELVAGAAALQLRATLASAAADGVRVTVNTPSPQEPQLPVRFDVTIPTGASGLSLANVTPLGADWALLRALFAQTAPESQEDSSFLRRSVLLRLPLDLRSVGAQWSTLADELRRQADGFDAQGTPTDRSEAASLEAALRAKVQAANYRAEANTWAGLVRNSQLVTLLVGPRGAPGDARAWQVALTDPPQTLQYAGWGVNYGGVLILAGAALLFVLLLAGLLWSLL